MNFLAGVNRVLRSNGIIRGDDDDLTSFSQTQHSATSSLAQIAIQDQLASLVASEFIPFEEASDTITMVEATRAYSLAADFIRFQDTPDEIRLFRLDGSSVPDGHFLPYAEEYKIRASFHDYRERQSTPIAFYLPKDTAAQVAVWPVPSATDEGTVYRYYYEKDVMVTDSADILPFRSEFVANIFIRMASRHFSIMFQQIGKPEAIDPDLFETDPVIVGLRGSLIDAMRGMPHNRKWIR